MIATIALENEEIKVDFSKPLDISLTTKPNGDSAHAWYISPMTIEPVILDGFVGDVKNGGSVNFRSIWFNPHAHATHTESVGHISLEDHSVNDSLNRHFFLAEVISVLPIRKGEDWVIDTAAFEHLIAKTKIEALIIRTLPNHSDKLSKNYSNTNPPYLDVSCAALFENLGVKHLLIDLPSVDKESDGGELAMHHAFWQYPYNTQFDKTITEFVFVKDAIADGSYLLNLQLAAFENDATPSRPVLYKLL